MKLSIIITHYKTPNLLENCLDSILKNVKGVDYEIIFVDSSAELSTEVILEEKFNLPVIHYLPFKENVGYGRSINAGLKYAKGEFIFVVNADILFQDAKSVSLMMDYLRMHRDVGLVGGKLFNIDGSVQQSYFREPTLGAILARRTSWRNTRWGKRSLAYYEFHRYNFGKPLEVDWLMGSCVMTRRDALREVGELDSRYWMYFEDVDWARRFRRHGYKVFYLPDAVFTHYHGHSSKGVKGIFDVFSNRYTRVHIKSWLKYLLKWRILAPLHLTSHI